jgi:hypothetical protein
VGGAESFRALNAEETLNAAEAGRERIRQRASGGRGGWGLDHRCGGSTSINGVEEH